MAEMGFTSYASGDNKTPQFEIVNGQYFVKETCEFDGVINLSYGDYLKYEKFSLFLLPFLVLTSCQNNDPYFNKKRYT